MTTETIYLVLPELVLLVLAVLVYVAGAFVEARKGWGWIAAGAIALSAAVLTWQGILPLPAAEGQGEGSAAAAAVADDDSGATDSHDPDRDQWPQLYKAGVASQRVSDSSARGSAAEGPVTADPLARYVRWLALVFGILLVLQVSHPRAAAGMPEYLGSLLLIITGLMLTTVAQDLVLLFVALELISIPTYIVLYLGRIPKRGQAPRDGVFVAETSAGARSQSPFWGSRDAAAQEAAAKYFFLSILASAMLLYGFAFLYGAAGSTDLGAVRRALAGQGTPAQFPALTRVAMVLVVAGLSFRLAAVPFHFYAPDVYQGTTYANGALLSVVPKAAALVALVRLVAIAMSAAPGIEAYAWRAALALSVLTMTLANVVGLWQDNLRRLLAYSSIAQAGYMLVGLAAGLATLGSASRWDGLSAMLFYLAAYAPPTLGSFAVLAYLGRPVQPLVAVDELAGLGRTRPLAAAVLSLFMFSLAGIPPLAGFWGKLLVFGSAFAAGTNGVAAGASLQPWFIGLAVIGVLNAAVAATYYLRVVAVMYFRTPLATPRAQGGPGPWAAAWICAVLVVAVGVYPGGLLRESNRASPTAVGAGHGLLSGGNPCYTGRYANHGHRVAAAAQQHRAADLRAR